MREILRKFDINSLYICPPYLYTVTTLPWEIKKVIFHQYYSHRLQIHYLRRNKLQLLYCSLSVYLLLSTISYCLRSFILWSVFICLVSHFQSHQCQPTTGSFQSHQHLEERNITCSQMYKFYIYRVVRWHFSGVVGKGVTVCFFLDNINNLKYV